MYKKFRLPKSREKSLMHLMNAFLRLVSLRKPIWLIESSRMPRTTSKTRVLLTWLSESRPWPPCTSLSPKIREEETVCQSHRQSTILVFQIRHSFRATPNLLIRRWCNQQQLRRRKRGDCRNKRSSCLANDKTFHLLYHLFLRWSPCLWASSCQTST